MVHVHNDYDYDTMDIVSYLYCLCTVHRYCQKLPSDRYAILAPDFSYEVRGDEHAMDATPAQCDDDERTFKCVLALPMNSPVRDPIAVSLQYNNSYRCDMHVHTCMRIMGTKRNLIKTPDYSLTI